MLYSIVLILSCGLLGMRQDITPMMMPSRVSPMLLSLAQDSRIFYPSRPAALRAPAKRGLLMEGSVSSELKNASVGFVDSRQFSRFNADRARLFWFASLQEDGWMSRSSTGMIIERMID